uniref:Uncharacterized protein n=1 Tax=Anguilla anguilla TaxID=7936 RepID=A0A0E9XLP3_ANGAN
MAAVHVCISMLLHIFVKLATFICYDI